MLSPQAWNAFLKTLEEPPPNTIFVLATTEAQKVLPTVVDRCHRFDFQRPTVAQIAGVLRKARRGRGHAGPRRRAGAPRPRRDRLVPRRARHARAARHVQRRRRSRTEDVLAVLGVADAELLFEAADAVAAHDERRGAARRSRDSPSPAATSASSSATSRRTRATLIVVQALGDVPAELRSRPTGRAPRRAGPARRRRSTWSRLLDCLAAALCGGQGRRRRPHPARARAGEGRGARASTPPPARCSRASSASRPASRAGPRPPGAAARAEAPQPRHRGKSHRRHGPRWPFCLCLCLPGRRRGGRGARARSRRPGR